MIKIRDHILSMRPYIPGEPADDPTVVKLNQNENRYPMSPKVAEAIRAAVDSLPLYPDSTSEGLRRTAAEIYGVAPDEVMATNGSDEMLRLLIQACCGEGDRILVFWPTYTYYQTLATMFGAEVGAIPFDLDGERVRIPADLSYRGQKFSMVILPNPNAPTGTFFPEGEIRRLVEAFPDIMVVLDEAYADFAGWSAIPLLREYPNLAVARTFSKSYALAGLRVGLGFARKEVLAEIEKIRDYYNLDRLSQAGAEAALRDQAWLRDMTAKVAATRARTTAEVRKLGVAVYDSGANFILLRFKSVEEADRVFLGLKRRKVLVRRFKHVQIPEGIRVTIGTDPDMDAFLAALEKETAVRG